MSSRSLLSSYFTSAGSTPGMHLFSLFRSRRTRNYGLWTDASFRFYKL